MALDFRMVRANLPPRTIMRGPGFLDAVLIIERYKCSVLFLRSSFEDLEPAEGQHVAHESAAAHHHAWPQLPRRRAHH